MHVFIYDGSFEGLLSCVYEGYYSETNPEGIYNTYLYQDDLFHEKKFIITDPEKAFKVSQAIVLKLSEDFLHQIVNAFFSEHYEVAIYIYKLLRYAFKAGPEVIKNLANPLVLNVVKLSTSVGRETHLLVGLVRFVKLKDEIYYCEFAPTYNQVALLAEHFSERFKNQIWVLHDIKRHMAVFYDKHQWYIRTFEGLKTYNLAEDEVLYQSLWKTFHQKIAITERLNPKLQQSFMPKKYWQYLIEMQ